MIEKYELKSVVKLPDDRVACHWLRIEPFPNDEPEIWQSMIWPKDMNPGVNIGDTFYLEIEFIEE